MSKTSIINVDIRDDKSVVVYYSTGTTRPYKSVDTLPKTALAWLEDHPIREAVTVTATPQGVTIKTAPAAQETTEEPYTEATETAENAAEEVQSIISPPATVEAKNRPLDVPIVVVPETMEPVRLEAITVAKLAALGITYNGLMLLSTGCHALAITAEIAEATGEVIQDIRGDIREAIHRTGHLLRRTAARIQEAAAKASRRAGRATRKAWGIISTWARQTATAVATEAREAWQWREELVTAETVIG